MSAPRAVGPSPNILITRSITAPPRLPASPPVPPTRRHSLLGTSSGSPYASKMVMVKTATTGALASEPSSSGLCGVGDSASSSSAATSCVFEAMDLHNESFKTLTEFFENDVFCDVEIKVGNKGFKCHRVILACVSEYFKTMFTTEMAESKRSVIQIKDIDEEALQSLIKFAYSAKILLSVDSVQSLLYASSILQIECVARACCEFMMAHLHPNNCIGVRAFATLHNRKELMNYADEYIKESFAECVESDEFVTMTHDHFEVILSSPDLNVRSETQVFEALMKWTNHDMATRKLQLAGLLSKVKLALLPADYLVKIVSANALIKGSLPCRDIVEDAKDYHISSTHPQQNIIPRKSCAGVVFCVGGRGSQVDPFKSIECFNLRKNSWFQVQEMSTKRRHVGVVSVRNKVYAVGGHDGTFHLSSGEVYDPLQNKWTPMASMSTMRRGLAIACLGGPLYAIGGLDDSICYNTVERYDPDTDTWSCVEDMNLPRGGVAVATLGGYIYAVGGNDGAVSLETCERYDQQLNKWTLCASMNTRRAGAGVAELNGFLYVVGGFDDNSPLDSVEKFDPKANQWTTMASMSCPRGGVGVAALAGKIYAVGGHDGSHYLQSVEAYDPSTDKWEMVASIATCRAGAGIATVMCHADELTAMKSTPTLPSAAERL